MIELNSHELNILGFDVIWQRRSRRENRLIVITDDLTDEEFYLVERICFSLCDSFDEEKVFFLKSLPEWLHNKDLVLDFVGKFLYQDNVLCLPKPKDVLKNPGLKRKIWSDLSELLLRK